MKTWVLFLSILGLASCSKNGSGVVPLQGQYIGFFHRNNTDTVQVALLFSGSRFSGQSSRALYPILCEGNFEQEKSEIRFQAGCAPDPQTDRSLTLDGLYRYQYNNDGSLRIWREGAGTIDEYILKIPVR